ncbi:ABC transporter substrate-binding protein [Streptomyces gardneri]|uniref:Alpha-glucoside ABC transporter substrate-binding protein n=1 Tax=Streptomyces gardneri TaxID=66892 RepID=A0A4Y3RT21_9ACTN|nr:extracellular solute-binding protein [Streptomyces gardneri]GEB60238.1 alpha-glucoside ABC transporter substrate-binding protein [Streptomyces gardneri]GHH21660.1 alpha-glucoside ABC transporter substrate-binding protein [Streptomyces gardneri]
MRFGARLALAGIALAALATACGVPQGSGSQSHTAVDCGPYARYGEHPGTKVTVYAENRDREADLFEETWADFADCTGIDVQYEGDGEFEAQIQLRVDGGSAPDVAFFPQPGLLERFARAGKLKPASAGVVALAKQGWSADWNSYATVNGTLYGTPLVANVKSFVWYSPKFFRDRGLSLPRTWSELMAVTEKVAASGVKPWCAGIESAEATGWPVTDWIEDVLLRQQGTDVYDQWVAHKIPFDDPRVIKAMDTVGSILRNDRYANGGFGPARSMASISFQEAGTPILSGDCAMHRQASFYAGLWPEGTEIGPDKDVYAFLLPGADPAGRPVLGGGVFTAAFADRPEVRAFQEYLASGDFANARMKKGPFVSANRGVDPANAATPVDRLSIQLLQDPRTQFRFDGSDLMPASVGAGTFWKGAVDWIGGANTRQVADSIERSWPSH